MATFHWNFYSLCGAVEKNIYSVPIGVLLFCVKNLNVSCYADHVVRNLQSFSPFLLTENEQKLEGRGEAWERGYILRKCYENNSISIAMRYTLL